MSGKTSDGLSRRAVMQDYRGDFVRMIADAVPATPDPRKD